VGAAERAVPLEREAVQVLGRLVAAHPGDQKILAELPDAQRNLGFALQRSGDFAGALAAYGTAVFTAEELVSKAPPERVALRKRGLGGHKMEVGEMLLALGRVEEALTSDRAGAALLDENATPEAFPQHLRSYAREKLGEAQLAAGDLVGAEQTLNESEKICAEVARLNKVEPEDDSDVASARQRLVALLLAKKDRAGATALLQKERDARARLAAKFPRDAGTQVDLAQAWLDTARLAPDAASARAAAAKGVAILGALAEKGRLPGEFRALFEELKKAAR
jgi:tetratricopeptide (TPR) repeat protein